MPTALRRFLDLVFYEIFVSFVPLVLNVVPAVYLALALVWPAWMLAEYLAKREWLAASWDGYEVGSRHGARLVGLWLVGLAFIASVSPASARLWRTGIFGEPIDNRCVVRRMASYKGQETDILEFRGRFTPIGPGLMVVFRTDRDTESYDNYKFNLCAPASGADRLGPPPLALVFQEQTKQGFIMWQWEGLVIGPSTSVCVVPTSGASLPFVKRAWFGPTEQFTEAMREHDWIEIRRHQCH